MSTQRKLAALVLILAFASGFAAVSGTPFDLDTSFGCDDCLEECYRQGYDPQTCYATLCAEACSLSTGGGPGLSL